MLSTETIKWRLQQGKLEPFDLVFWQGTGRVVAADDRALSLQVRGKRADYTWDRVTLTLRRLQENQSLSVDELGGGHDAVGLVSLFVALFPEELAVDERNGLVRTPATDGKPVRPDPGPYLPPDWSPLERKIAGN